MSSPQKKLLQEFRNKAAMREDCKLLASVPIGIKFPIKQFSVRQSKQYDSAGQVIANPETPLFTLCVHYKIRSLSYYTYLPTDYHSPNKAEFEEKAQTFNDGITTEPLSLVYYGKSGNGHVVDFLDNEEEIDQGKITGSKPDERYESPKKKPRVE